MQHSQQDDVSQTRHWERIEQMYRYVSVLRQGVKAAHAQLDAELTQTAQAKADLLFSHGYWTNIDLFDGPSYHENLSVSKTAREAFLDWMENPYFFLTMAEPKWHRVGIGLRDTIWVLHFGQ